MEVKRRRLDVKDIDYDTVMDLLNSSITTEICDGLLILKKKVVSRADAVNFMSDNRACFLALLKLFDRLHTTLLSSTIELEPQMKTALRESSSVLANVCHFSVTACAEVSQWPRIATLLLNLLEHQAGGRMKANVLRLIGNLCNFNETSSLVAHNSALLEAIALNIKQSDSVIVDRSIRVMRLLARNTIRLKSVILSNCTFHTGLRILRLKSTEEVKRNKDILQILLSLVRVYPKDVGRQLVGSGCGPILLDILLNDDEANDIEKKNKSEEDKTVDYLWRSFLLKLTRHSHDIREAFGRDAIDRVLSSNNLNGFRCEFLCHFTQDAWARVIMSEQKVLARMLDLLNSEECSARQQMKIIASLKHFIYDTQSMAYLCQRGGFIRIAMFHIKRFVDESSIECSRERINTSSLQKPAECSMKDDKSSTSRTSGKSAAKSQSSTDVVVNARVAGNSEQKEIDVISEEFFCGPLSRTPLSPGNVNIRSPTGLNRWAWSPSMSPNSTAYEATTSGFSLGTVPSVTLERTIEQDERYRLDDTTVAAAASLLDNANLDDEMADDEVSRESSDTRSVGDDRKLATEWKINDKSLSKIQSDVENELDSRTKRLVVADCLEIISKLTHQEDNYPYLVKEEVLHTLIDYISETSVYDPQVMRSIMRLSRCKRVLQTLLEMNFHIMVINKLIRRRCILTRFGEFCRRCDRCREFGCDMIRDFARHADSNMGWYHVEMGLRSDCAQVVRNALITGLTMIHSDRTQRFYSIYMPIEMLLLNLSEILGGEWKAEKEPPKCIPSEVVGERSFTMKKEEGHICCEIVMAFSSLVTRRALRSFSNVNLTFETPTRYEKRCSLYETNIWEREQANVSKRECIMQVLMSEYQDKTTKDQQKQRNIEVLEFYNANDLKKGPILIVPKEELCHSNPYFHGMFDHEFVEKIEGRYTFDENEDQCDETDFIKFMHYLVGCRDSECVEVNSAETCAALIQLSDKYLCNSLISELIKPGGAAQTMIRGGTLRFFLRPMLTIPSVLQALENTWIFVLLRYSTNDQLFDTFEYFRTNSIARTWLLEALQRFLLVCTTNEVSDYQTSLSNVSLWDV